MAEALDGLLQMVIALVVGPHIVAYALVFPPDGKAVERYEEACKVVVKGEWKNGACVGGDWKHALTLIERKKG